MTSFMILDLRSFTGKLFRETTFDHFLVPEAEFATDFTIKIDGRRLAADSDSDSDKMEGTRNSGSAEGAENGADKKPEEFNSEFISEFISWKKLRPLAYQIIRGKKLPHHFHIILKLNRENTDRTLAYLGFPPEEGVGLYLNLRYEEKKLFCITGCSRSAFSLDRSLEREWDGYIRGFLRRHQLDFEEG